MILILVLGIASIFHHHHKPAPPPAKPPAIIAPTPKTPKTLYGLDISTEDMQSQATELEVEMLASLGPLHAKMGNLIPEVCYTNLANDILTLSQESVLDPSFKTDWNKFGDDIDAMSAEIVWLKTHKLA